MKFKATTTLRFDEEVFKALKLISAKKKINMSDIVEIALLKYYLGDESISKDIASILGEQFISKMKKMLEEYNKEMEENAN